MNKEKLKAEERKVTGRKVKMLRAKSILPANIYGKKVKSEAIEIPMADFEKIFKEAGETTLIDLTVGKKVHPVLISNIQVHPVTGELLHVDFREVDLKEKVHATIPVELTGESPADKQGVGVLVQLVDEVEVDALPTDLPEKFEINIDGLAEVDNAVTVKDIKVDKSKVEILNDKDQIIAKVEALQKEEEIAPAPATEGEAGAEGGETTEGEVSSEAPAGGEAPEESKEA